MSSTVELDENFFTCTICNDSYNDPRSLPCLHSFCCVCLSQHICYSALESPPSFLCPVCRGLTLVPAEGKPVEEWAELFPGNFWLKDLMSQISSPDNTQKAGIAGFVISTCSEHPGQQISMFCISCQVAACNTCISVKHTDCLRFVSLVQNDNDLKNTIGSCIERLEKEIAETQSFTGQIGNDISYLTRQRDKVRNAIENHVANFVVKLDRAKKDLFSKLDSEYQNLKREMDYQLLKDNQRVIHMKSLKATAHDLILKSSDPEVAGHVDDVLAKVNEVTSCTDGRPQFARMRATFAPDYSWLGKEVHLGTVSFYNSKHLAGLSEGPSDCPPSLTRSHSSVQLRRPASVDFGQAVLTSNTNLTRRPVSAPLLQQPDLQGQSSPAQVQQYHTGQYSTAAGLQNNDSFVTCVSAPWLLRNDTTQSQNSTYAFQQMNTNANPPCETTTLNESRDLTETDTSRERNSSVNPLERKSQIVTESPIFACGEDIICSSASGYTKNVPVRMNGSDSYQSIHPSPTPATQLPEVRIESRILSRFTLKSEDDQQLPMITSIIITSDGYIVTADSANKSIKMFKNEKLCVTINLQNRPCGLAAASEDRLVTSTPESSELVVISRSGDPKIVSTVQVQKRYSRLMNYRPGITAAVCPDLGCIDLVTLLGKTMKTFRVFDEPNIDIPFCVDAKQELTIWDSVASCFMVIPRSGSKTHKEVCYSLKDTDVTGVTCDSSGLTYVIYDSKVAIVTKKGDDIRSIENVFSCQCMSVAYDGKLYVVETGGECKVLNIQM